MNTTPNMPGWLAPTFNLPTLTLGVKVPNASNGWSFKNYLNKWGGLNYNLLNAGISAGADIAGNLINSNGLSSGAGNIMSGIGNIVGNIPGPIGWAGKGLALAGLAVNALWGHKFNDANVAAAESANRERSNWLFGDYSNTDALLAGSMANVQLGNVNKAFLGKEGPFSHKVSDKMKEINNDRMMANLRANNSELNAYNNYQTNTVRNAIAGDSMGNVNAAAYGGLLNAFANGGRTHGSLFNNGFIEVNNGGSHELNPNQGVLYGVDPQGTPNMVEEGETILDDYVFSKRIKFPKKYKDEFSLGGKIWKKSFADVSKMIAKESEERPNDPISQRSLKAMGGKLADIQEEVKAKQALDKMDPREVMAMLLQLAMLQLDGELPLMQEEQMMADPYQQQMMLELGMEEQPIMAANGGSIYIKPSKRGTFTAEASKHGKSVQDFASQVLANPDNYSSAMVKKANFARNAAKWHACGGKLHAYGGNLFPVGGYVARSDSGSQYANNAANQMLLHMPIKNTVDIAKQENARRNEAARRKVNARGVEETVAEKKERYRKNKSNLSKARKYQKIADNLQKILPKKYNTNQGSIYDADAIDKARMLKDDLINSARSIGQTLGKDLDVYTQQDAINSMYNTANLANLSGYAAGIGIEDPIAAAVGLAGSYLGSEIGGRVSDSPYAPLIGALIGGGLAGGESRIGRPAKVFVTEEEAARNAARDAYLMKVGLPVPPKDFYAGFPLEMFTTPGWHTDPTTLFPTVRGGMTTLGAMYGLDKALEGFGVEKNNNADGGPVNLFKRGSKIKSKYKSDNDWEKMYELSRPIYQQFINAGIDPMVAMGVLSNIAAESSFNHEATNGSHWGYVLNDKTLKNYIKSMYGGYDSKHQIQFLIDGLTNGIKGHKIGTGKKIQARFNNYLLSMKDVTDPATAANLWEKHYEISGGQGMYDRRNYANKFWDKYNPQVSLQPSVINPEPSVFSAENFVPSGDFAISNLDAMNTLLASVSNTSDTPYDYAANASGKNVTPNYTPINNKRTWDDFKDINGNSLYNVENKKYADIYTDPKFLEWAWDNPDNDYLNNQDNFINWYKQYKNAPTNKDIFGERGKTGITNRRGKFTAGKGFDKLLGDAHFYVQHMVNKYLAQQNPEVAKKLEEKQKEQELKKEDSPVNKDPVRTLAEQQAANKLLRLEREKYKEGPIKYIIRSVDANGTPTDKEIQYNPDTFATEHPGYKYSKEDDREYDDENKTFTRKFIYTKLPEVKEDNRPTWMRYLPPAALGVMALTDSLGITNKLDNSIANQLYASSSDAGRYTPVRSTPLPNPYVWTPQNRNYIFGDINNTEAGAARTAANLYGNNIGALVGNLATIRANANKARSESYAAINENDMKNFKEIAGLRLGVDQNNAKNSLDAQVANQGAFANALKSRNDALIKGAEYAYKAKHDRDENISSNMSEFLQSLADIGTENMNWNWRNWAIRSGAFGPMKSMPSSDVWWS